MRATGLWAAMEAARRANLQAAGERAPRTGEEGSTRRALLLALAGASAAAPREAFAAARGPVAIVGGGIAGLSALHRLRQAGVAAHLYEARPRLGGRMYTARTPGMEPLEIGCQLVNTDHVDLRGLAKTFGVNLIDRKAKPSRTLVFADGRLVPEAEAVEALRPLAAQIARDADRLDKDYARVGPELDRLSYSGYLDRHADKLTAPWVRGLMETTARTENGVEPGEASAIQLVFNLPTVEGERVEVLSTSDERYLFEHGTGSLIDAMHEKLAAHISLRRQVVEIAATATGVRLHFADGRHADAGSVIVTTPAGVTRDIRFTTGLPLLWRRYLNEVRLGRCEKLFATLSSRPYDAVMGRGGEMWRTQAEGAALGWDGTVRPSTSNGAMWTWFLGGAQVDAAAALPPLDAARAFASSVEAGVPGMTAATTAGRLTGWRNEPFTRGAYVNYRPGQMTRFASLIWVEKNDKLARAPLSSGRVHFAGEHLSDAFPGYMNGAAQTGRLAADSVLAQMGRRAAA